MKFLTKMFVGMFALMLLSSLAFAGQDGWTLPSEPFGSAMSKTGGLRVSAPTGGELDLVSLPTASIGYGVGPNSIPTYGYAGGYDFVLGTTNPGDTNGVDFNPIIGAGASFYIDMAQFINSHGVNPVLADGGFNVIGPEIQGLVPSANFVWNFQTGEKFSTVNLSTAIDFFGSATVKKIVTIHQ